MKNSLPGRKQVAGSWKKVLFKLFLPASCLQFPAFSPESKKYVVSTTIFSTSAPQLFLLPGAQFQWEKFPPFPFPV
jgi:hypothetical protein